MQTALRRRALSSVELVERALALASSAHEWELGAFVELTPEAALAQARAADDELRAGRARGPLHGLPLAVKDVIDVGGVATRLGTPGAGHRVPSADADVVRLARAAGAIPIGKTATHELAYGMTTPAVANPRDRTRTTGGSSGGSAAAVAAGLAPLALGTDTNGSVRCPAALCGVVGLKPTFGRVPRGGVAPLAWSQDVVGPLAENVAGCAALHAALTERPALADLRRADELCVGADRELCERAAAPEVGRSVLAALDALAADGARVVEVKLPDQALAGAASYVTIVAEAHRAWGSRLEHGEAFSADIAAALRVGAQVSADAYLRAAQARTLLRRQLAELFAASGVDALAMPTVPVVAAERDAARVLLDGGLRPVESAHARFTALASLCGGPALSVPCGVDADGLPIGLQLLGRPDGEAALLRVGAAVERGRGGAPLA
ncbi:MAG TPA: amidase [Conexibacter sp.]